jgi:O-antigen ligase
MNLPDLTITAGALDDDASALCLPDAIAETPQVVLMPLLRWLFVLFVFSIPLEFLDLTGGRSLFTPTKLIGILLAAAAVLLQPKICFTRPPRAFWWFSAYVFVYSIRGLFQEKLGEYTLGVIITLMQCLAVLWLSFNLFRFGFAERAVLIAMMLSTFLVAVLTEFGMGAEEIVGNTAVSREAGFGYDPNHLAYLYTMGILAGLEIIGGKGVAFYWRLIGFAIVPLLSIKIVATSSRGGMICLAISVVVYCLAARGMAARMKGIVLGGMLAATFAFVLFRSDLALDRWKLVFAEGNIAGRDVIYQDCIDLILEKPLAGWGPTTHCYELAKREAYPGISRDTHNDILWALTATGLAGGIFFVGGLGWSLKAGWQGRAGRAGAVPLALMVASLVFGMTCTAHKRKPFWIAAAMASAAGAIAVGARTNLRRSKLY